MKSVLVLVCAAALSAFMSMEGSQVSAAEVEIMQGIEAEPAAADLSAAPAGDAASSMAASAHAKADLALSKIKTAKELRAKARESLAAKGKPIPEILKAGALDDVNQRVQDAKSKLSSKFGDNKDSELEAKAEAKRENPAAVATEVADDEEADASKIEAKTATKKAEMYKSELEASKKELKVVKEEEAAKEKAVEEKVAAEKKVLTAKASKKVSELEVKMKQKLTEKLQSGAVESDADFNHRQIAQEAYNKQVMGYVLSWEKTHGGPAIKPDESAAIKDDLTNFVEGYEAQHAKITGDIQVSDTPTR